MFWSYFQVHRPLLKIKSYNRYQIEAHDWASIQRRKGVTYNTFEILFRTKNSKKFPSSNEIRAHDPPSFRSEALSTELDDDIAWDRCKLTVSNECWRSGVRTGLSGVCVGVDSGVGVPVVCVSGLQVSSSFGTVEVNMSRMQRHALCHISGENWEPFETTRFSRQLVPDLASCSLSRKIQKRTFRVRDYLHDTRRTRTITTNVLFNTTMSVSQDFLNE